MHHHNGSPVPRNLLPRALRGYLNQFSLRHPIIHATLFGGNNDGVRETDWHSETASSDPNHSTDWSKEHYGSS